MDTSFDKYLEIGNNALIHVFKNYDIGEEEKKIILNRFTGELINNVGNANNLVEPEKLIYSLSLEYIDKKLYDIVVNEDISYDDCNKGINLCNEMKELVAVFMSKNWETGKIKNNNINSSEDIIKNKMKSIFIISDVIGKDNEISNLIDKGIDNLNQEDCEKTIDLLGELEIVIEKCKKDKIKLPNIKNNDTKKITKEILGYKDVIIERTQLYDEMINTDTRIDELQHLNSNCDDNWEEIIRLCKNQINLFEECNKKHWKKPNLKYSSPKNVMNKYVHYQEMSSIDNEIDNVDLSALSNKSYNNYVLICEQQLDNFDKCKNNNWNIPDLNNKDIGKLLKIAKANKEKKDKRAKIKTRLYFIVAGIVFLIILGIFINEEWKKGKIRVPFDSNFLSNVKYDYIENELKNAGFKNVLIQADNTGWKEEDNVTSVVINNENKFSKGNYFDPEVTVIIKYSSKNRLDASKVLGEWRFDKYTDIVESLKKIGFTNINIQEKDTFNMEEDLKIASISLNSLEYSSGQCFIPTSAPIEIVYYTLKIAIGNENASFVGQDYKNVVNNLKNMGYTNVATEEIFTGWSKGNSVISVSINNKTDYKGSDVFKPDDRISIKYSSNDNRIDITKELYNWNNAKYDALKNILNIKGFKNIKLEALDTFDSNLNEKVSSITINGEDYLGGECHLQKPASIVLKHYILKLKIIAKDSDIRGKQYKEIVDKLKENGFTNITLYRSDDLVNGWINKEGAIKSISIDGNEKFTDNDMFNFNAEIKIVVNTFRDKEYEDKMFKRE